MKFILVIRSAGFLLAQLGDLNIADADPQKDSSCGSGRIARQLSPDWDKTLSFSCLPELRRDVADANVRVNRVTLVFRQLETDLADAGGGFDVAGDIGDVHFADAMFDQQRRLAG